MKTLKIFFTKSYRFFLTYPLNNLKACQANPKDSDIRRQTKKKGSDKTGIFEKSTQKAPLRKDQPKAILKTVKVGKDTI